MPAEGHDACVIAIVGAESSGKTSLARTLAQALAARSGLACTWVPEYLRQWCDEQGRTPRRDEQAAIARRQSALIDAAAAQHAIVVCDTTALMTAVYSHTVFGDDSLDDEALALHRRCRLTLLTALDLPWVADGLMRSGAHVQLPVDERLRTLLARGPVPWSLISGHGDARLAAALAVCERHLPPMGGTRSNLEPPLRTGLFTRLSAAGSGGWQLDCERCSDPRCEHLALLAARRGAAPSVDGA